MTDILPTCDEDTHYWLDNPTEGDPCLCATKGWRAPSWLAGYPPAASAEETAAFLAEMAAVELDGTEDPEEGVRRWLE